MLVNFFKRTSIDIGTEFCSFGYVSLPRAYISNARGIKNLRLNGSGTVHVNAVDVESAFSQQVVFKVAFRIAFRISSLTPSLLLDRN